MFKTQKSPSEELTMTNMIFFNNADWNPNSKYVRMNCNSRTFVFKADIHQSVSKGYCTMGVVQRRWVYCGIGELVECLPFDINPSHAYLLECVIELDFFSKNTIMKDPIDSEKLALKWQERFMNSPLTQGQPILFNGENINFEALVKSVKVMNIENGNELPEEKLGITHANTVIKFSRKNESRLILGGRCLDESQNVNIINPNWDFNSIGVGGIDKQFSEIFRRAFISRLLPPDLIERIAMKHVRGILMYGPPGTGKTLMARQIGKMLNAREPKIVNGPSILDKYVGESEANIRKLFADAEEEFKRMGNNSALHIIIFDEIDAICKSRGSFGGGGGSAVQDTVVNQLLSKMDGVEQLNNILVIGMTNRRDMIDEALLRPGRMEVQIEISLPDEAGRLQIIEIHTSKLRELNILGEDVSLAELASLTKNFSGAEIEGLVKAAFSNAQIEKFDPKKGMIMKREDFDSFKVLRSHFIYALDNDVKPFFGSRDEQLEELCSNQVVVWGPPLANLLTKASISIQSIRTDPAVRKETLLLYGPSRSGLTTLATRLAQDSEFSFIRLISLRAMLGFTEASRCLAIKKHFDDALRAPSAAIILDDIETLIDYSSIGPRFSVTMVNSLISLVKGYVPQHKKLLVIGTTQEYSAMRDLKILAAFDPQQALRVPLIRTAEEAVAVLAEQELFSDEELNKAIQLLKGMARSLNAGVKDLVAQCEILRSVEPRRRLDILIEKLSQRHEEDESILSGDTMQSLRW